jgi:hypothetical protein
MAGCELGPALPSAANRSALQELHLNSATSLQPLLLQNVLAASRLTKLVLTDVSGLVDLQFLSAAPALQYLDLQGGWPLFVLLLGTMSQCVSSHSRHFAIAFLVPLAYCNQLRQMFLPPADPSFILRVACRCDCELSDSHSHLQMTSYLGIGRPEPEEPHRSLIAGSCIGSW